MKTGIFLFFSIILFGCLGDRSVEEKIVSHIEANCKQFPCVVRMSEITDFEWDKMFVISDGSTLDEIEKVTGTNIPQRREFKRKLVFTKDGKLVRYDELPTNIEGMVNNQVTFDNYGKYTYKVYLVNNAIFEAYTHSENNQTYYHLKQQSFEK